MKTITYFALATLINLFLYSDDIPFEYSDFYKDLSAENIRTYFGKFLPDGVQAESTAGGSSTFNGIKGFHFVHEANPEDAKILLLAYGDGIERALKTKGFFVGAITNPRHGKERKPLKYSIFATNENNICDVVIYAHRISESSVKIETVFREYLKK